MARNPEIPAFVAWWERTQQNRALCPVPNADFATVRYDLFLAELYDQWRAAQNALELALAPLREQLETIIREQTALIIAQLESGKPALRAKIDQIVATARGENSDALRAWVAEGAEDILKKTIRDLDNVREVLVEQPPLLSLGSNVNDLSTACQYDDEWCGGARYWRWRIDKHPIAVEHHVLVGRIAATWGDWEGRVLRQPRAAINAAIGQSPWTAWRLVSSFFESVVDPDRGQDFLLLSMIEAWATHLAGAFDCWWKSNGWTGNPQVSRLVLSPPDGDPTLLLDTLHRVLVNRQGAPNPKFDNVLQQILLPPAVWLRFAIEQVVAGRPRERKRASGRGRSRKRIALRGRGRLLRSKGIEGVAAAGPAPAAGARSTPETAAPPARPAHRPAAGVVHHAPAAVLPGAHDGAAAVAPDRVAAARAQTLRAALLRAVYHHERHRTPLRWEVERSLEAPELGEAAVRPDPGPVAATKFMHGQALSARELHLTTGNYAIGFARTAAPSLEPAGRRGVPLALVIAEVLPLLAPADKPGAHESAAAQRAQLDRRFGARREFEDARAALAADDLLEEVEPTAGREFFEIFPAPPLAFDLSRIIATGCDSGWSLSRRRDVSSADGQPQCREALPRLVFDAAAGHCCVIRLVDDPGTRNCCVTRVLIKVWDKSGFRAGESDGKGDTWDWPGGLALVEPWYRLTASGREWCEHGPEQGGAGQDRKPLALPAAGKGAAARSAPEAAATKAQRNGRSKKAATPKRDCKQKAVESWEEVCRELGGTPTRSAAYKALKQSGALKQYGWDKLPPETVYRYWRAAGMNSRN